ncbi:helix-turn-helix transcriptional regulator [Marinobacterium lutimaris]|uniref:Uncharacterized protein n=1 Tax=Marinobacterium lutimaris TaxID=568106 RepID=A0A1H5YD69_9GAMM|nr:hypothetical protein [Marinobacterium lutimaris]SEG21366.1 hypothetical protein SAMN05444390_1011693 [Marinobacterium lutimaris]
MITETKNGYAAAGWEASPGKLSNGLNLTKAGAMVMLMTFCGFTAKEIAKARGCSPKAIKQIKADVYFKTGTDKAIKAINKLLDEGALHRLPVILLAALLGSVSITSANDLDHDIERQGRTRRTTQRTKTGRRNRSAGASLDRMFSDLDFWLSGTAGDVYTYADMRGAA